MIFNHLSANFSPVQTVECSKIIDQSTVILAEMNILYSVFIYLIEKGVGLIEIDSVTGTLTSALRFDREELAGFSVQVVGYDGGVPSLSSTATISVTITDVNDNAPVFTEARFEARYLIFLLQKLAQLQ